MDQGWMNAKPGRTLDSGGVPLNDLRAIQIVEHALCPRIQTRDHPLIAINHWRAIGVLLRAGGVSPENSGCL
jgi:hypothetical protein